MEPVHCRLSAGERVFELRGMRLSTQNVLLLGKSPRRRDGEDDGIEKHHCNEQQKRGEGKNAKRQIKAAVAYLRHEAQPHLR